MNKICPIISAVMSLDDSKRDCNSQVSEIDCLKEKCAWWIKEEVVDFKSLAKGAGLTGEYLGRIENITLPGHCGRVDAQSPEIKSRMESMGKLIAELAMKDK